MRRKKTLHRARNEAFYRRIDEIRTSGCGRYDYRGVRVADQLVFKDMLLSAGARVVSIEEIYDELVICELSRMKEELLQNSVYGRFACDVLVITGTQGFKCRYPDEDHKMRQILDRMEEKHAVVYI